MKRLWCALIVVWLALSLMLTSCAGFSTSTVMAPAATLIPAYIGTPQAAQAQAQATIARAQAEQANMALTATVVSMQMTQAAATDERFQRQTQAAATATAVQATAWQQATLESGHATATAVVAAQQARSAQATADQLTSYQHGTATALAFDAESRATATQSALIVLRANTDAELQRIEERRQAETQTLLYRTWGYRVFWASIGLLVVMVLAALVHSIWKFRMAIFGRLGLVRWGKNGKPYMPIPLPGGGLAMLDMTKSSGPVVAVLPNGDASQPAMVDLAIQNQISSRSQAAELLLAASAGQPAAKTMAKAVKAPESSRPVAEDPGIIDAPWALMNEWQSGPIPLGVGPRGLLTAGNDIAPNLLVAGTTGSGKTRCLLRPYAAASLAAGRQVIILDRSGVDFQPFENHSNAVIIPLDRPEDAAGYLRSIYTELQGRLRSLVGARHSTWERWEEHGPEIVVVLDEFSNLADEMDSSGRDELWRRARMVAAEGRKAGIQLAIALQDPTRRSIDLRIRRNCTLISFRVQDATASQIVLGAPGAEQLIPGHFLTVLNGLQHGVGFHPSDEDIMAFLDRRPVVAIPDPDWLCLPSGGDPLDEISTIAEAIRPAWQQGERNMSALARLCNQVNAGAFHYKLERAIALLRSTTATREPIEAFG